MTPTEQLILLFALTILQNGSFTLVSRARNSGSYWYNAGASVLSNGIWLIVVQQVVSKPNDIATGIAYVTGAVIGSVLMQWVAIRFLEKKKPKKPQALVNAIPSYEWKDRPDYKPENRGSLTNPPKRSALTDAPSPCNEVQLTEPEVCSLVATDKSDNVVSHDVALLLKSLGYRELSWYAYDRIGMLCTNHQNDFQKENGSEYNSSGNYCSAPTIEDAKRFLKKIGHEYEW